MKRHPNYCKKCGGRAHEFGCWGRMDWPAIMAYQIRDGHEMTLDEIGKVAGSSREAIRLVEFGALRKLQRSLLARKILSDEIRA